MKSSMTKQIKAFLKPRRRGTLVTYFGGHTYSEAQWRRCHLRRLQKEYQRRASYLLAHPNEKEWQELNNPPKPRWVCFGVIP